VGKGKKGGKDQRLAASHFIFSLGEEGGEIKKKGKGGVDF